MQPSEQPPPTTTAISTPTWAPGMRQEVRRLVREAAGARRRPHQAWVGRPGGDTDRDALRLPPLDGEPVPTLSLVLTRALEGLADPAAAIVWVARLGDLEPDATDRAWWTAAHAACHATGHPLRAFCLVSRRGWRDLESDQGRTWARVRVRR